MPAHLETHSRFEKLPQPILLSICEWLTVHEPRTKRSFCALALTSKTCRNATDAQRFRYLNLFVRGLRKLHRDIQSWRQLIQTGDRMRFLRVIKIIGNTISSENEEQDTNAGQDLEQMRQLLQRKRWPGQRDDDEYKEKPMLLSGMDNPLSADAVQGIPSTQWPDEEPWKALAGLFQELPRLEDVVFASRDQFPRCLLSQLHSSHPWCRLHMHYFCLRSLICSRLEPPQVMHPDDLALATSPCLYSIVATTSPCRGPDAFDYNEDAIMDMVSGLAPQLTNVCIVNAFSQATQATRGNISRPPWAGVPTSLAESHRKQATQSHVQNLILSTHKLSTDGLIQWARRTDFTKLRSLSLRSGVGMSTVAQLVQIARRIPY